MNLPDIGLLNCFYVFLLMLGVFRTDATTRREVLSMIGTPAGNVGGNV